MFKSRAIVFFFQSTGPAKKQVSSQKGLLSFKMYFNSDFIRLIPGWVARRRSERGWKSFPPMWKNLSTTH